MKLLLDENLSARLVSVLSDLYPGSCHVKDVGLEGATDREVWNYAISNDLVVVSKDSDFHERSVAYGSPPKVIWLRIGNCSTNDIKTLLRTHVEAIYKFDADQFASFMVIS